MSHELRTPLHAIFGHAQLLSSNRRILKHDHEDSIQTILHACENVISLVNDLVDISKVDEDVFLLQSEWVRLSTISEYVYNINRQSASQKSLKFHVHMEDSLKDVYIWGDFKRISQVLVNLVGNAVKFTDKGSVDLWIERTKNTKKLYEHIGQREKAFQAEQVNALKREDKGEIIDFTFRVTDTGIGLSANDLTKIFKDFRQIQSSANRMRGGSGLGLAISRKLAIQMGGVLQASSSGRRKGSSFTLTIPLITCAEAELKRLHVSHSLRDLNGVVNTVSLPVTTASSMSHDFSRTASTIDELSEGLLTKELHLARTVSRSTVLPADSYRVMRSFVDRGGSSEDDTTDNTEMKSTGGDTTDVLYSVDDNSDREDDEFEESGELACAPSSALSKRLPLAKDSVIQNTEEGGGKRIEVYKTYSQNAAGSWEDVTKVPEHVYKDWHPGREPTLLLEQSLDNSKSAPVTTKEKSKDDIHIKATRGLSPATENSSRKRANTSSSGAISGQAARPGSLWKRIDGARSPLTRSGNGKERKKKEKELKKISLGFGQGDTMDWSSSHDKVCKATKEKGKGIVGATATGSSAIKKKLGRREMKDSSEKEKKKKKKKAHSKEKGKKEKTTLKDAGILLVEDNVTSQVVVKAFLSRLGYSVSISPDGLHAASRFMSNPDKYKIILMDHQMPVMDGVKCCKVIRATEARLNLPPSIIIALSAHSTASTDVKFISAGFSHFLSKPIFFDTFATLIQDSVREVEEKVSLEEEDDDSIMRVFSMPASSSSIVVPNPVPSASTGSSPTTSPRTKRKPFGRNGSTDRILSLIFRKGEKS